MPQIARCYVTPDLFHFCETFYNSYLLRGVSVPFQNIVGYKH